MSKKPSLVKYLEKFIKALMALYSARILFRRNGAKQYDIKIEPNQKRYHSYPKIKIVQSNNLQKIIPASIQEFKIDATHAKGKTYYDLIHNKKELSIQSIEAINKSHY